MSDCVTTVSAGCGPHQRYINEAMVRTSAVSMLPARCWPAAPVQDTSDQPIVQCVEDLTVNLAAHAKGNTTGNTYTRPAPPPAPSCRNNFIGRPGDTGQLGLTLQLVQLKQL